MWYHYPDKSSQVGRAGEGFQAEDLFFPPISTLNISKIRLTERYPDVGYTKNTDSDMIVYVIAGDIFFQSSAGTKRNSSVHLKTGDTFLVPKGLFYYWNPDPSVYLFVVSTPPWNQEQQVSVIF